MTFAVVPQRLLFTLVYLGYVLWIVGILLWVVVLWSVYELGRSALAAWGRRSVDPDAAEDPVVLGGPVARVARVCVVIVAVSGSIAVAVLGVNGSIASSHEFVSRQDDAFVSRIATGIEDSVPRGRVSISFSGRSPHSGSMYSLDKVPEFAVGLGVAWQLTIDGWQPALSHTFTGWTGITYPASSYRWPAVTVAVNGNHVKVIRTPTPAT